MWNELWVAIALLLIIEGALPFLNPGAVRRAVIRIAELNDGTLRFVGLTCMVLGCLTLFIVR